MTTSTIPIVTVTTCKEFPPHTGHWYEVAVALDADDEPHVIETDGMFETAEEAQAAGDAWAASPVGRETIANVVAAKRRILRLILERLLTNVAEPDAATEPEGGPPW
jgi:hypothetical protein